MIDCDPHHWRSHLLDLHGTTLREISLRLGTLTLWAALIVALHSKWPSIVVPSTAHALVGVALGLLLVFRTNASYDRYWEGRKLWGGIVNESRNLARSASVLLREDPELRLETLQWMTLFPYSVMHKLRGTGFQVDFPGPASRALEVAGAQHPALAISVRLTECIQRARKTGVIGDIQQGMLDQNLQQLVDYLGACERIHKTPLPFAYVVHLRRALILYCSTVPFALADTFGWTTPVAVALIGYVFLGIEEIGVEIEDPFGQDPNDLPLERICETIRKNVVALI